MKIRIFDTAAGVSRAAARFILEHLARKPDLVLGLPTGRTVIGLYRELVKLHEAGRADFSHAHTVNLDELAGLAPDDSRSFCGFMREHLFDRVNIPRENIHFLDGSARNLSRECERFELKLHRLGGIDLLLLGIGRNAHIAFNEPGPSLRLRTHPVRLTTSTRTSNRARFGNQTRLVPTRALTMGMGTLLEAQKILVIATGDEKAQAVARLADGTISSRYPASFLQLHSSVEVLLDAAAAKKLMQSRLPANRR